MPDFDGKVALVIGGTSGIGRTTALAYARAGAKVVVAGRNETRGAESVAAIEEAGAEGVFIPVDVTDSDSVRDLISAAEAAYGRIDCAFNAAGQESRRAPVAEIDEAEWQRLLDLRLTGAMRCVKYELPALLRNGGGSIVNMAGDWGLYGVAGFATACAAIHGILGLTRAAAKDYAAQNIRVNAVCPGAVRTPMLERMAGERGSAADDYGAALAIGRIADPEEVAEAVLWLSSPRASYVNGESLVLNGGG